MQTTRRIGRQHTDMSKSTQLDTLIIYIYYNRGSENVILPTIGPTKGSKHPEAASYGHRSIIFRQKLRELRSQASTLWSIPDTKLLLPVPVYDEWFWKNSL